MKFVDNMRDEQSKKLHKLITDKGTLEYWRINFCPHCEFGIISYPSSVRRCGVPFWLARAMMQQFAAIVYCDCKHGADLMQRDANTLARVRTLHSFGVDQRDREMYWTTDPPEDYIPGAWWSAVREACEVRT